MWLSRNVLISGIVAALCLAEVGRADTWPPTPGQTGSITVQAPNAQNGASASVWGFYTGPSGWASTTFGTGTISDGTATISYTVPANFISSFYWNVTVKYSTASDEKGQYYDASGGWGQFMTDNPNGQTVNVPVYQFDQRKVTTSTASFRASAQGGTLFPPASLTTGSVTVRRPWTGTMAQFTAPTGGYYDYSKTSLLPTRLAARGFLVEVIEGDPAATQQFQKIRLYKADESYSVELFGYKNITSDDPLGYLWWTTLVDVASADCTYNSVTGVFNGTFATPVPTGVMYFVAPEFDVREAVDSSKFTWVQAGSGTDLLLSGTTFVANKLSLDPEAVSLYVKRGESVIVNLNVSNLQQMVKACQAILGYSSTFFSAGEGAIVAGGGAWDDLIYSSWTTAGELDTAVGVYGESMTGAGTQADGTVAKITLTVKDSAPDGTTNLVFRNDVDCDDTRTQCTYLADMNADPVFPTKANSVNIIVDSTTPSINAPTDTTVMSAQYNLEASAEDVLSGIDSFTMNGTPFTSPTTVTLTPGENTFTFVATDKAGNQKTCVVTITYSQPSPTITVSHAIAPNASAGSSSFNAWLANQITAVLTDDPGPIGSDYAMYKDLGTAAQDYAAAIVTPFKSWMGFITTDSEWGNRTTYVYRLNNGVKDNPGAAKLNLDNITVTWDWNFVGVDSSDDDYTYHFGYAWNAGTYATKTFAAGPQRLKGYNWDGTQWVEVTSGRLADLIIYNNGEGYEPEKDPGNVAKPATQATINELYKQLTGALASTGSGRQTVTDSNFIVNYSGHAGVDGATSGDAGFKYQSADVTKPVIDLTEPADGATVNKAAISITGTATDNEDLASGIRQVTIQLGSNEVYSNAANDNVSFTQEVTLLEGDNTVTVTASDFAGNTETKTITVMLDTVAPLISIDDTLGTDPVTQGSYTITVTASDAASGLADAPVVKLDGTVLTTTDTGPWTYTVVVDASTANGAHVITADINDNAGNSAAQAVREFTVNKNQITGTVMMSYIGAGTRTVTFILDGNDAASMTAEVDSGGTYTLTNIPDGVTSVSAKTAWTLRQKLTGLFATDGQITANFTLKPGDLDGSNSVNVLDYTKLKTKWFTTFDASDINGDGGVNTLDYQIMQGNWFKVGDAK